MKTIAVGLATTLAMALAYPPAALAATHQPATTSAAAPVQDEARTVEGTVRQQATDPIRPPATAGSASHSHLVLATPTETLTLMGRTARPNTRVRVTGMVSEGTMHAETITEIGAAPAPVQTHGTTRILLMLAYWTAPDSVTPESAATQLFTDTHNWYRDASYGQLGLTGEVTPWLKIAGPIGGQCYADSGNIMAQAKTAALAQGFDAADYDDFVVYFPINVGQPGSDCNPYAGWAYVGAQGAWLNGYLDRYTTVHELGHNYGLWHSHSYICASGLSGSCAFQEYGDPFDTMGNRTAVGHFSAPQKYLLGWLGNRMVDLTQGGTATLAPIAADPVATTGVRIAASPTRTYWLEYRQPIDFDSAVPSWGSDGVLIHVVDQSIAADGGPNLIDARPSDGPSTQNATLRSGSSWTSPEGVKVTVGAVTAAGAAVTVGPGSSNCPDLALEEDSAQNAGTVAVPTTQHRGFCTPSDQDWVRFAAVAGQSYQLETLNLATAKPVDTALALFAADGTTVIDTNNDSDGKASRIVFTPTTSDTYVLRAEQADAKGGEGYTYDLQVALTDTSTPTVSTQTPADDATGVDRGDSVTATFSKAVTGVDTSTFTLSNAKTGSTVKSTVSRVGSTHQWLLNPRGDLASDTRYTATLTGGPTAIRDTSGNPLADTSWSFLTGAAPTLKSRRPAVGATGVSRTDNVSATFSETVTGVDAASFALVAPGTGTLVRATVSRKGDKNQWQLDPRGDLASDTLYTVILTGGPTAIRDIAGNPLATTSWSFVTGPAPTVTSSSPKSGAKNVSRSDSVAVTFSEPVTGVDATTFTVRKGSGSPLSATIVRNGSGTEWILDPSSTLSSSTKYTVTVTGGANAVRDAGGNALSSRSWTFTTKK